MALLEVINGSRTFPGVTALKHVNLKIEPGTIHALLGENGAGKSTLIKALSGIQPLTEGHILWEGNPVQLNPNNALKLGIATVYQELTLVPQLTIYQNIMLGRERNISHLGFMNNKEIRRKAMRAVIWMNYIRTRKHYLAM